jgi:hypothetical protein
MLAVCSRSLGSNPTVARVYNVNIKDLLIPASWDRKMQAAQFNPDRASMAEITSSSTKHWPHIQHKL